MVQRCLQSVQKYLRAEDSCIVIDDASAHVEMASVLAPFQHLPRFRILKNSQNIGFVRTVNAGLALSCDDVLLLNSDAILTEGALDQIARCAYSQDKIASVTPMSNNAEICSYPMFCQNNPEPSSPEVVAQAFAKAGQPLYPDCPTGVGFCMFMRRDCIAEIGVLDADTFGHGYGEENDWCQRAIQAGWINVICDTAYVVHAGGQSFQDTEHRPGGENLEKLLDRFPDYNNQVAQFIAADPLAERRHVVMQWLAERGRDAHGNELTDNSRLDQTE